MLVRKNQSQFQNIAFLLVNKQILIDFYSLTFWQKDTFNFGASLKYLATLCVLTLR